MRAERAFLFTLGFLCLKVGAALGTDFLAAPKVENYTRIQKSKVIQFEEDFFFSNLVWHPADSNLVFATGGNHKVILYDLCAQKTLWTFIRPDAYPETFMPLVFVNPSGTMVATTDLFGRVFVIDAGSGRLIATLRTSVGERPGYLPQGVLFSIDGHSMWVLASDDSIMEFETVTFSLVRRKTLPNVSMGKSILEIDSGNLLIADQHRVHLIARGDYSSIATYDVHSGVGAPTLRQGRYLQIVQTSDWSDYHPFIIDLKTGSLVQTFPEAHFYPYLNDLVGDLSISVNSSMMGDRDITESCV